MKRDAIRIIEETINKVSERYDMKLSEISNIEKYSNGNRGLSIMNGFVFGYAQGRKAAIAEMKKKAKEVKVV